MTPFVLILSPSPIISLLNLESCSFIYWIKTPKLDTPSLKLWLESSPLILFSFFPCSYSCQSKKEHSWMQKKPTPQPIIEECVSAGNSESDAANTSTSSFSTLVKFQFFLQQNFFLQKIDKNVFFPK